MSSKSGATLWADENYNHFTVTGGSKEDIIAALRTDAKQDVNPMIAETASALLLMVSSDWNLLS